MASCTAPPHPGTSSPANISVASSRDIESSSGSISPPPAASISLSCLSVAPPPPPDDDDDEGFLDARPSPGPFAEAPTVLPALAVVTLLFPAAAEAVVGRLATGGGGTSSSNLKDTSHIPFYHPSD